MAGDPLFDSWAERILASAAGREEAAVLERRPDLAPALLTSLLARDGSPELAAHLASLPAVCDRRRFAGARAIFVAHGPLILFSLAAASLPECYTIGKAVGVLERTGRLEHDLYGRMYRTAQFILEAMGPATFTSLEDGLAALLRPRLMHALVRQRQRGHGAVIASDDQLFTLAAFSFVSLRTLERCHVTLTAAARADWMHRWAAIGIVMGLDPAAIPAREADCAAAFTAYQQAHGQRTIAGRALRTTLLGFLADLLGGRRLGAMLARQVVRELTSARTVELLGMRMDRPGDRLFGSVVRLALAEQPTRSWLTRRFIDGFFARARVDFPFHLPPELQAAWR